MKYTKTLIFQKLCQAPHAVAQHSTGKKTKLSPYD
jgi:hypothetical protein